MNAPPLLVNDVPIPRFLYGTAWKEEATESLTGMAISQGFRGIDTANQRRHYHEAGVGQAVSAALGTGLVTRDALFLQTKFTFLPGQDHRLPYDPKASIGEQVEQSFASSLRHLRTDYVDSYLLHGPLHREGLGDAEWQAWEAIEAVHQSGRAKLIGVSNFTAEQLRLLVEHSTVPPMLVQNRCYAVLGWDREVRQFCRSRDMVYQGFSLLTANAQALGHPTIAALARRYRRTIPQIVFRFAIDVGMLPLTGTTTQDHMRDDLKVFDFELAPDEVEAIERVVIQPAI